MRGGVGSGLAGGLWKKNSGFWEEGEVGGVLGGEGMLDSRRLEY